MKYSAESFQWQPRLFSAELPCWRLPVPSFSLHLSFWCMTQHIKQHANLLLLFQSCIIHWETQRSATNKKFISQKDWHKSHLSLFWEAERMAGLPSVTSVHTESQTVWEAILMQPSKIQTNAECARWWMVVWLWCERSGWSELIGTIGTVFCKLGLALPRQAVWASGCTAGAT